MSLPDQEARALDAAREFLLDLASGAYKVGTITALRTDARRIVKHYPLLARERFTSMPSDQRWAVEAAIHEHEGEVGTHWETCWKHHAGCLARVLRDMEGSDDDG